MENLSEIEQVPKGPQSVASVVEIGKRRHPGGQETGTDGQLNPWNTTEAEPTAVNPWNTTEAEPTAVNPWNTTEAEPTAVNPWNTTEAEPTAVNPWNTTEAEPPHESGVASDESSAMPSEPQMATDQEQGGREMLNMDRPQDDIAHAPENARVEDRSVDVIHKPMVQAEAQVSERITDVPVEDLFNGVINVLGDGLELAIIGTEKAIQLLALVPDKALAQFKASSDIIGDTLLRLTGRSRQVSRQAGRSTRQADETGLE